MIQFDILGICMLKQTHKADNISLYSLVNHLVIDQFASLKMVNLYKLLFELEMNIIITSEIHKISDLQLQPLLNHKDLHHIIAVLFGTIYQIT